MRDHVVICGPVAWNQLVYLDRLPEPRPHVQFALDDYETVGGTSAGKALNLAGLGRAVVCHTVLGDDSVSARLRWVLEAAGVAVSAPGAHRGQRAAPQPHDEGGGTGVALSLGSRVRRTGRR
jgi:sugar/nucleoside kinase (ribokinase family)